MAARDLRLKPEPEPICGLCGITGLVVRDLVFRRCVCPRGALPGIEQWDGHAIDPRDAL